MANVLLADLTQFLLDSLGGQMAGLGFVSQASGDLASGDKTPTIRVSRFCRGSCLSLGRALGFFAGSYFMNKVARSVVHVLRTQLFDVQGAKAHIDKSPQVTSIESPST